MIAERDIIIACAAVIGVMLTAISVATIFWYRYGYDLIFTQVKFDSGDSSHFITNIFLYSRYVAKTGNYNSLM